MTDETEGKDYRNLRVIGTPIVFALGTLVGAISSVIDPSFLRKLYREVGNNEEMNRPGVEAVYSGTLYGYLGGVAAWSYNILENPENPVSYIPLATNLVSGVGQFIYQRGKASGRKEEFDEGISKKIRERENKSDLETEETQ